ncbi:MULTISPECIES: helix-turn-helix domain-containing protein [Ahrensia]|uniref:Helix-turn-helix transcriptional regulator n=1 Tax=Ahrensia kielensis TaxID=76980 RepID=A0ABU9T7A7_9HYPH
MTPFGERVRELRNERGMTQKEMAKQLNVSAAYLSALEHGKRGTPRWILVQQIIACLNIIWDDADELQTLALRSAPRVTIDTTQLSPRATELANLLASGIDVLSDTAIEDLRIRLDAAIRNSAKIPKYLPRE